MLSRADLRAKISLEKNLVSDQTYTNIHKLNNVSGIAFNATHGLGEAANNSSVFALAVGGFNDQKVTADVKWVSPTTAGNEEIGVIVRFKTFHSPNADYYYARVDGGIAKLTKVVAGTFTTLSQTTYALGIDVVCRITLSVMGSLLTATFAATGGTPADIQLSSSDTSIPSGGLVGVRSLTSSIWCSYIKGEEL